MLGYTSVLVHRGILVKWVCMSVTAYIHAKVLKHKIRCRDNINDELTLKSVCLLGIVW